ncbi:CRISPR-associated endonuclease Cas2 [Anaerolinea thermophila]|uniref:CRISPR-associated endoribonuclease Cas2 n=1 Tax=Anaerolinea thermophila (strain DSM 14523 / JCM 11388 / NBRC 100420 / UNI-1) TaxID=926569 RepID=E8MZD7_ANATU|nr:CRISPR-associated endonuclease Cas2 [Anaerolinea thermophila]BAJ64485.1 hypothetical protein ANT_24590 [Anaerolinea thermophila UNI-1]
MNDGRSFYVLAYDISDDRRRLKLARLMESLGVRVQGSVFEAYLTATELERLLRRCSKILKKEEDSLRIYRLCTACRENIRTEGKGKITPPPQVTVI